MSPLRNLDYNQQLLSKYPQLLIKMLILRVCFKDETYLISRKVDVQGTDVTINFTICYRQC